MVHPTGELNGETLTLKHKRIKKTVVLNNFSIVADKNVGVNFLVTISKKDPFKTFTCILNTRQYIDLLSLQSQKKIEENNRKEEEMNKRIEEMEKKNVEEMNKRIEEMEKKNAEEMNKRIEEMEKNNAKEIEEFKKQFEKPDLIEQNSINFFGKSASSLKQSDLENIVVEGKISCSPYFVKIAHNYSCLQKLKNNDFPACDGANDEGKKNDAKYEIENCVNSSFAIVKNAVKSFCGDKSINFCDIETELESILKSAGKYVVSVIQKSFVESEDSSTKSKKEDEEEVVMDIDDSEPTDTENAEHSEDFSNFSTFKLRKLCKKKVLSPKGDKKALIKRLNSDKKIPKSIEEFYGIDSGYFASWKYKCMEMEQITNRIFEEIFAIGNSFLAQNENTVNAIIAAHLNKTFDKSLNNCGIRYNNNQGESTGKSQNNPVTPDILITTVKNKTNIVVEIKYGTYNSYDAKYQNAGYVISIADDYRKNSKKNQSCIPMLSMIVNVSKDKIAKPDNDNSIGNLSLYGYVPCKNLTTKNMKYIECILLEDEKFTSKNFANILLAICSVNQLPEAAPISSHNACVHGDKVFKCYDNPNSARSFAYTGYLPGAKMLCKDTVLVYDKIEGTHHPQNLNQVLHILKQLCNLWEKNLCHGDIRLANIIFGDNSHLIDYDFCGEDGVATYPDGFNREIKDTIRHKYAKAYNVLKKEHDWFSMQAILHWYKCDHELWSFLLDERTGWESIHAMISTKYPDISNATLTPTDDNPMVQPKKSDQHTAPKKTDTKQPTSNKIEDKKEKKQNKNAQRISSTNHQQRSKNIPLINPSKKKKEQNEHKVKKATLVGTRNSSAQASQKVSPSSENASPVKKAPPPKQAIKKTTSSPVRSVKASGKGSGTGRVKIASAVPVSTGRRKTSLASPANQQKTSAPVKQAIEKVMLSGTKRRLPDRKDPSLKRRIIK